MEADCETSRTSCASLSMRSTRNGSGTPSQTSAAHNQPARGDRTGGPHDALRVAWRSSATSIELGEPCVGIGADEVGVQKISRLLLVPGHQMPVAVVGD